MAPQVAFHTKRSRRADRLAIAKKRISDFGLLLKNRSTRWRYITIGFCVVVASGLVASVANAWTQFYFHGYNWNSEHSTTIPYGGTHTDFNLESWAGMNASSMGWEALNGIRTTVGNSLNSVYSAHLESGAVNAKCGTSNADESTYVNNCYASNAF